MFVQKLNDCLEFVAGDGTLLRELFHPDKHPLDLRYSLAHAIVPVGQTSIPHALSMSEVYYILTGRGEMHINEETQTVESGSAIYIPPNARQFIHNSGDEPLIFICIVDPAWWKEDERIYSRS